MATKRTMMRIRQIKARAIILRNQMEGLLESDAEWQKGIDSAYDNLGDAASRMDDVITGLHVALGEPDE